MLEIKCNRDNSVLFIEQQTSSLLLLLSVFSVKRRVPMLSAANYLKCRLRGLVTRTSGSMILRLLLFLRLQTHINLKQRAKSYNRSKNLIITFLRTITYTLSAYIIWNCATQTKSGTVVQLKLSALISIRHFNQEKAF